MLAFDPRRGPPVVTVAEMRRLEAATEASGTSLDTLMANAGRAVAVWIDRHHDRARQPLLCLVGPGNNGGDGLVAAAHLARAGWQVSAATWQRRRDPDWPLAQAQAAGVRLYSADQAPARALAEAAGGALVLDSLFGIGLSRTFAGPLAEFLHRLRHTVPLRRVIALDTPSGAGNDAGQVDRVALPAGVTLTLGGAKIGLYRFPAAEFAGRVVVLDIGLPRAVTDPLPVRLLTDDWIGSLLPDRPLHANKGSFGRAAIIAGCADYPGAAALTSAAAVRAGAGIVTLAATARVGAIAAAHAAEPTHLTLPETPAGALSDAGAEVVRRQLTGYDALLLGPGLGQAESTRRLVWSVLAGWRDAGQVAVIDADALNALAREPRWWESIAPGNVLTPHPGEMARLLGGTMAPHEVDAERFTVAPAAARRWGQIVVLKGAFTVVANPDGAVAVSPVATPALATAGSGDVLAGLTTGLLAQDLDAWTAAMAAVLIHARAGERLAGELGEAGGAAGDLVGRLPGAQQRLRSAADQASRPA